MPASSSIASKVRATVRSRTTMIKLGEQPRHRRSKGSTTKPVKRAHQQCRRSESSTTTPAE
uniref:Uncharacterized protein n=1 Tax=Manihot esculenta TaxID=3983 RepID=A0A2C9VSD3_MANES